VAGDREMRPALEVRSICSKMQKTNTTLPDRKK
jgi:hypothetical protein